MKWSPGATPPQEKVWETVGEPNLWVIGRYRMGLEITPGGNAAELRVFIEYALPRAGFARVLGLLFGKIYARWCTMRVVGDARRHFQHALTDRRHPRREPGGSRAGALSH